MKEVRTIGKNDFVDFMSTDIRKNRLTHRHKKQQWMTEALLDHMEQRR